MVCGEGILLSFCCVSSQNSGAFLPRKEGERVRFMSRQLALCWGLVEGLVLVIKGSEMYMFGVRPRD